MARLGRHTCVEVAADFLDRDDQYRDNCYPWFWRVNPDTLDMNNNTDCVLGQAYGNFANHASRRIVEQVGVAPFMANRTWWREVIMARRERRPAMYRCGIAAIDDLDLRRPPKENPLFVPAEWTTEKREPLMA